VVPHFVKPANHQQLVLFRGGKGLGSGRHFDLLEKTFGRVYAESSVPHQEVAFEGMTDRGWAVLGVHRASGMI
jgi:hypothetical protein